MKYKLSRNNTKLSSIKLLSLSLFILGGNNMPAFAAQLGSEPTSLIEVANDDKVTLNVSHKTLRQVFALIEQQTNYLIGYNSDVPDLDHQVDVKLANASIAQTMNAILNGTRLQYEISGRQIMVFEKSRQNRKVAGIVLDENNEPLIGVNIQSKDKSVGTVTDVNGQFSLDGAVGNTLVFSYVGYKPLEMKVSPNMKVRLLTDNEQLDEVVVIGYGTMKKSDLTGSVSGVKAKDFNKGLISSPTQLLQGRASGVVITNNGGEPGSGVSIRVRGSNSIRSGQDPLYVVDGVPLNVSDDQQPSGGSISGVGSSSKKNPLSFLNPDDIESIDVLKDASATAIYGARGANGVIMITTKKGAAGKMQISYSTYATVSWLPSEYDVLSADDYRDASRKYNYTITDKGANTNWQDLIFRTSLSHSHNVSLSGGTETGNYRASVAYQDQEGIVKTSSMKKYNGRFYAMQKLLNNKLQFEANIIVSRVDNRQPPLGESGGQEGDLLLSALRLNPTFPVRNEDGTYFQYSNANRNPVAMLDLTKDNTQTDRFIGNLTGTLELFKNLKYKLNVAFDETKASRKVQQNEQLIYCDDGGTVDIHNVEAHSMLIENYLTSQFDLGTNKEHHFDLLAGHSYQKTRDYVYGFAESGFFVKNIDYIYDLSLSTKKAAIVGSSDITLNELQSFFARVNYNLKNRYLFTANVRVDGSTKFGENNKYGTFPSAAFAWRMSEESFIKKLNVFDNLKLRLSWGQTGNQEIPNKISQMLLGSNGKGTIFGTSSTSVVPGITLTRTPNPDLKWERTEQTNVGIDFGFFNNRLTGSVDYFYKATKDVLLQVPSTSPSPTTTVWRNIPDMSIQNKGWEVILNGRIIDGKDFGWDMGLNLSTAKNKIKDLPVEYFTIGKPSGPGFDGETAQIIKSGYAIGTFWGKRFLGFDEEGKSMFKKDADGNVVKECIGNALPDMTLNFNTTFTWKNFDLSLYFNSVIGNDIYNNLANVVDNRGFMSAGYNTTYGAVNSKEAIGNALEYSDRYIEDGSYLRLSNATLGYNVPLKHNPWIRNLRCYITANNLFCLTGYSGYDPEVNASRSTDGIPTIGIGWTQYPMARSLSFGVNIDF